MISTVGETVVTGTVGVNVGDEIIVELGEATTSFSVGIIKGVMPFSVLTALLFLEINRE